MTFRTFATQIQEQQQEVSAQGTPPGPAVSVDADIAAFLAEGHEPDDVAEPAEPGADDGASEPEAEAEADAVPDLDGAEPDGSEPEVDAEADPEAPAIGTAPDLTALKKALDSGDPIAFVKALGKAAEKVLGSKAHIALRLAVKDAEKHGAAAVAEQKKAETLAIALGEKYGDPIAARKAAEAGDVDSFVTMVEKWSGGHSWNDVMKWVTSGLAGRKERLERKERQTNAEATEQAAKREQKQAEVRAWVDTGVKKLAPELHDPEVVDLVVAEIRAGYAKGITTPAKALPLVRKKLEARYKRLHAVFGKGGSAPRASAPSPSAAAAHTDGGTKTRRTTLEEDIAWTKKLVRGAQ